ncbi:MAG: PASTA domain-containing protein [Flavobacteriales bacterium]|nr:PASTA domain-containing protein [Flavobacteriales bacterium]
MLKGIWLIVKNFMLMFLVLVGIAIIAFFALNIYTRKGETIEVPKITGLHVNEAITKLQSADLDYLIIDSVFDENLERHHVSDQNPKAFSKVKSGRKIALIVNSLDVPEVEMPDIAGKMSFEQAVKVLKGLGLEIGQIIETPDPSITTKSDKPIFGQLYKGEAVKPGTKLKRKSRIDLIVGVMQNMIYTDSTSVAEDSTIVDGVD